MEKAAIGLRAHSGWAALVAIALYSNSTKAKETQVSSPALTVLCRRRLLLTPPGVPAQPYHAAQAAALDAAGAASLTHRGEKQSAVLQAGDTLNLARAEKIIQRASDGACRLAKQRIEALLGELRKKGYEVRGCGILSGSGRIPSTLASTLASHTAIHTAEGELFRGALARAAEDCGLPVLRIPERDLLVRASATLALAAGELQKCVASLGKEVGAPWRQDEKFATLMAWLVLADLPKHPEHL